MEFDLHTMAQIVLVQLNTIKKYCENILDDGQVNGKDVNKIQRMFNIVNEK